jgi:hypothetical protein
MADQTYYKGIRGIFSNDQNDASNSTINKCTNRLVDSIDGNLNNVQKSIESNQFCFFYLYADWCARSIYYKELIENLTCSHSNEVIINNRKNFNSKKKYFNNLRFHFQQ